MRASNKTRKRSDYYFRFSTTPFLHKFILKNPKFPSRNQYPNRHTHTKNPVWTTYLHSESTNSLPREVNSPCSVQKLGLSKCRKRAYLRVKFSGIVKGKGKRGYTMGNALSYCFGIGKAKKRTAVGSRKGVKKYDEVIDLDAEEAAGLNGGYDDSSIEEIEVLAYGNEGRSTGSNERSVESNWAIIDVEELDSKNVGKSSLYSPISLGVTKLANRHKKVEDAGKMFGIMPPNNNAGITVEWRNSKLSGFKHDNDYEEAHLSRLRLDPLVKIPKKVELQEAFVPLTKEEHNEVARTLSGDRSRVLVIHQNSNIEITGELLQCLRPGAWLNDEVINVYLELLKERERRDPKKFLQCHFFNTFFYEKLISGKDGYDFKSVRRWTTKRKLGYNLIDCDKIFVPIHKEIHWSLAVVNVKAAKFQYLDSLGGKDSQVLKILARYFVDEVMDKSEKNVDVSSWKQEFVEGVPHQKNGWDCGMFMIKYADFYSRGAGINFDQGDMPYFRQRTAKEILRLRAD